MKKFFRKGEVGDWKNHLHGEVLKQFDEWSKYYIKTFFLRHSFFKLFMATIEQHLLGTNTGKQLS
jgi:hypothetical protein